MLLQVPLLLCEMAFLLLFSPKEVLRLERLALVILQLDAM